jgi:hypothetical protein
MSQCVDTPERQRDIELSGIVTFGFETSMLETCSDVAESPTSAYGNRRTIWIDYVDSVRFRPGVKWPKPRRGDDYPRVFARYLGTLYGPGAYGHLGVGGYRLLVREVLEARRPKAPDCK